jgi:hypothetical protein
MASTWALRISAFNYLKHIFKMDARPKRRSIRLRGYDYSRSGAYFVSLCTKDRKCLFGDIENQQMALNDAGRMMTGMGAHLLGNAIF